MRDAFRSGAPRALARMIPRSSKKVLTQNLRDLEAAGVVTRKDFSDVVLHIEYELNEDIKDSVLDLLDYLARWGDAFLKNGNGSITKEEQGQVPEEELDSGRAAGERGRS